MISITSWHLRGIEVQEETKSGRGRNGVRRASTTSVYLYVALWSAGLGTSHRVFYRDVDTISAFWVLRANRHTVGIVFVNPKTEYRAAANSKINAIFFVRWVERIFFYILRFSRTETSRKIITRIGNKRRKRRPIQNLWFYDHNEISFSLSSSEVRKRPRFRHFRVAVKMFTFPRLIRREQKSLNRLGPYSKMRTLVLLRNTPSSRSTRNIIVRDQFGFVLEFRDEKFLF